MTYCTLEDVNGLLVGFEVTDTTDVTITQLNNEIIPDIDQYIDDRLGKYYVTPITGPKALVTINRIAKYLSAAEVVSRIYLGQAPSDSSQSVEWNKKAEDTLQRIVNGEIILSDATPNGDTPVPASQLISSKVGSSTDSGPYFTSGMTF